MFDKEIDTLCLMGGGNQIVTVIGALKFLDKKKYFILSNIKKIAGTSAGSILATLLCIGYTVSELEQFVLKCDFKKLKFGIDYKNIFSNVFSKYGLFNTKLIILNIFPIFLYHKLGVLDITFLELYKKTNIELQIATCNYSRGISENLSYKNFPDLSIITGIAASASNPFISIPVEIDNEYYIDGVYLPYRGMDKFNKETTLVIMLCEKKFFVNSIINYLTGLQNIIVCDSFNKNYAMEQKYKLLLIDWDSKYDNVKKTMFYSLVYNLNKKEIISLLDLGKEFAEKYYNNLKT